MSTCITWYEGWCLGKIAEVFVFNFLLFMLIALETDGHFDLWTLMWCNICSFQGDFVWNKIRCSTAEINEAGNLKKRRNFQNFLNERNHKSFNCISIWKYFTFFASSFLFPRPAGKWMKMNWYCPITDNLRPGITFKIFLKIIFKHFPGLVPH